MIILISVKKFDILCCSVVDNGYRTEYIEDLNAWVIWVSEEKGFAADPTIRK